MEQGWGGSRTWRGGFALPVRGCGPPWRRVCGWRLQLPGGMALKEMGLGGLRRCEVERACQVCLTRVEIWLGEERY